MPSLSSASEEESRMKVKKRRLWRQTLPKWIVGPYFSKTGWLGAVPRESKGAVAREWCRCRG